MASVLLVEPPSIQRDEVVRRLTAAGHPVRAVEDGEEAYALWRAERQQLAIIEEATPRLSGISLATRLKHESALGYMPIILLTGRPEARIAALGVADDALVRPVDPLELVARVNALVRTRTLVDELRAARAESEARTYADVTTGLRNRVFLGERLHEEFKRAMRYNEPLSLVLIAVEGLREIVSDRGVATGDRQLQRVADTALGSLRQIDIVTRYGPTELAALLPETHVSGALVCAERLRGEIGALTIDQHRLSASIGIAFYPGKEITEAADLLKIAGRALERAREEGPGSICLFQHQGYLFQPR